MPPIYNVKQTDSGTSGGYNTAFTIKPPKKGKPTNNWFFQTPVNQIKQPAPAPAVNSVAKGDPSVQSFINLMRGTALSMPTFDPYETPLVGDPYDHGTSGGYNTAFTIKPPKKKNPKPLWDYTTPLIQNKQPAPPQPVWYKYNTGWQPNSNDPYVVNSVAKGDPSVQSFINLMRGTALSMPTFDPYETPLVGDPYDHGTYAVPNQVVNSVAKGDPSVQSFINLMRGTALSMPTFDPYETPLVGDPYDHGAYVATTAPNVNPYQADIDWAMAKRQKNSPQDYFDRIVLNGRTYAVPNQMLNFAKDYPWDTLPSWYAPPADFTGSPEWKEVTGPPADNGAPTGGGWGGGGWGGGGGGFTPMPSSPRYTGYGGGYNPSRSPRPAYYQGRYGSSGGGGGYVGSQSQRGAWYGALLQWNI